MGVFSAYRRTLSRLSPRVGRRTQYWVVYTVDEQARTVDILQFWNASRDPERFEP